MWKFKINQLINVNGKYYIITGIVDSQLGMTVIGGFDYAIEECDGNGKALGGEIKYVFENDIIYNTIN
jgi:hypothetical protein